MNQRPSFMGVLLVTSLALSCAVFIWATYNGSKTPTGLSPSALYSSQLHDSDGKLIALGQWQGKVMILNFWATWCAPCRQEIPLLIQIQQQYANSGVRVIGIAVDNLDKTKLFSAEMGISYPLLIDEEKGVLLSKRLGNHAGGLPFTAIIDREGHITFTKTGLLKNQEIDTALQKLI